jgi:hypothetical protein
MPSPNVYNGNLYGGMRARAIRSSIYWWIKNNLTTLGWFSTSSNFTPITFLDEIPNFTGNEAIALNTLALIDGEDVSQDAEIGMYFGKDTWTFSVDFYAENDSVGLAVNKDIQRLLEGRQPGIGVITPIIPIYDYTYATLATPPATPLATPPYIGYLDVENISANRVSGPAAWQRFWWIVTFDVVDYNLT